MFASRLSVRSMATVAKGVKPPKQLFGIDGTYATALFTAASKSTSIEAANKSLGDLEALVKADPKLGEFFANPALSLGDRKLVVSTLKEKIPSLDASVTNFLTVLAENNRFAELGAITKQFSILNEAFNGVVEATVTSAVALDNKTLSKIQTAISKSKYVAAGQTLKITNQVNPEILGGLVVEVADRTADLSISSKVSRLNKALQEAI
ncbi:hypothetical protein BABINDRAFT_160447 [Babjeviella inositovora NRRL Y-12698]|uniref:ATP synthase subunit 5, mitochondrial n=1 Tax=Babjeviella inositovora NRRL Y-12698 TaxID=984486 RepID=A0A1E3QVN9_9ASCO|nr:uncharacterized protein BABINDRAFT_160447 [Babjeviella inositovora NRRL Y-12698]ODQ81027.1 hypothetical protein BABINDRAFT_160447 [Babjeviella inositovora NRRL Y-12698]